MGKKLFLALSFMLLALSVKGQNPNLDGVWVLKNVTAYQYLSNDSIEIDKNELPTNYITGAFDTLNIVDNECSLNVLDNITKQVFAIKSVVNVSANVISLYATTEPFNYSIVEKTLTSMVLSRKFNYYDGDNTKQYIVKLTYNK